jgi:predicted phosphodiesterase
MFFLQLQSIFWVLASFVSRCPIPRRSNSASTLLAASSKTTLANAYLPSKSGRACESSQAILIDVENLRGKSGFAVSHKDVMTSLSLWSQQSHLQGRLTLVIDHGTEATALWLPDMEYAVVFAGRSQKADDVLATDLVPYFTDFAQVTVVTADHGLIQRCRRAASLQQTLHILSPIELLTDLEFLLGTIRAKDEELQASIVVDKIAVSAESRCLTPSTHEAQYVSPDVTRQLDYEIKLGGELLEAEATIRSRSGVNNKRRTKLMQKIRVLREKLAKANALSGSQISMVDRVTDVLTNDGATVCSLHGISTAQQNDLLARWEKVRESSNRREKTGDRVILSEKLRRSLIEKYGLSSMNSPSDSDDTSAEVLPPGRAFVLRRQASMFPQLPGLDKHSTARIVVVSDTHGFEEQLLPGGHEILPPGDILLHLGDFAVDHGPVKEYLEKFDMWLSKQPHPIKIVVRGNHDPRLLHFPLSRATYLTQTTSLKIAGYSFFIAPYTSSLRGESIPRSCDVLVSHVPPRNILDRCFSGQNVGHVKLRRGAERMKGGPPALWLCGHIHEGRGSMRHVFAGSKETLVINAANANTGQATCIEHGPVVVDLQRSGEAGGNTKAEIVHMDGQYKHINQNAAPFFTADGTFDCVNELLMAVDLGLRTGVSLYSNVGKLVRYEQFQFDSPDSLHIAASHLLHQWEIDASNSTHSWAVTRIAIEGGDPPLREAWRLAANGQRVLLQVKPEEWRADLLVTKEKMDGDSAKAASRLIARQIVADYGVERHDGCKFQTDMAESILLGLHVSRRLGWIARNPPVRRYTNGGVIVTDS